MNEGMFSPLAPVDYVLEQVGLPRIDLFLQEIAPKNVLGACAGLPDLGMEIENKVKALACPPKLPGSEKLTEQVKRLE